MSLTNKAPSKNKFQKVSSTVFEVFPDGSVNPFPVFVMSNGDIRKSTMVNGVNAWLTHSEFLAMQVSNELANKLEAEKNNPKKEASKLKVSKK